MTGFQDLGQEKKGVTLSPSSFGILHNIDNHHHLLGFY